MCTHLCECTCLYLEWTLAVVVLDLLVGSPDQQHPGAVILEAGRTGRGGVSQKSALGVRASDGD